MGAMGGILGSAILGAGMASMSAKPSLSYGTDVSSEMEAEKPEAPIATDPDSDEKNALMEEEREKERKKAAWRKEQGKEVFTSGLGASGLAETNHKTLLGG